MRNVSFESIPAEGSSRLRKKDDDILARVFLSSHSLSTSEIRNSCNIIDVLTFERVLNPVEQWRIQGTKQPYNMKQKK